MPTLIGPGVTDLPLLLPRFSAITPEKLSVLITGALMSRGFCGHLFQPKSHDPADQIERQRFVKWKLNGPFGERVISEFLFEGCNCRCAGIEPDVTRMGREPYQIFTLSKGRDAISNCLFSLGRRLSDSSTHCLEKVLYRLGES